MSALLENVVCLLGVPLGEAANLKRKIDRPIGPLVQSFRVVASVANDTVLSPAQGGYP